MTQKLTGLKRAYYSYLDRKARHIAHNLSKGRKVTKLLLDYIRELYRSAKSDVSFKNEKFEVAYSNPISSELEFLLARILYHYSNSKKLGWKIYLRRQIGKTAPDIRIEKNKKTIAIVEIKAKAGWIQPFFSSERFKKDMEKLRSGKSDFDPTMLIKRVKAQLKKYCETYEINQKRIFFFLPTLKLVHRKKSLIKVKSYINQFAANSGLPKSNLILLSKNLLLDLSSNCSGKDYNTTNKFEEFIWSIDKREK